MKIIFICIWVSGYLPIMTFDTNINNFNPKGVVEHIEIFNSEKELTKFINKKIDLTMGKQWEFSNPDKIYSYDFKTSKLQEYEVIPITKKVTKEIIDEKTVGYKIEAVD